MKFIDLTRDEPVEQELSLPEIQELLKRETGRSLSIRDMQLYKDNEALFKLVRWPDPVGFGIAAATNIPKGTPLFYYGGRLKEKNNVADKSNFYEQVIDDAGRFRDAKDLGDLGSLLVHLPTATRLKELGFSDDSQKVVQTCNTRYGTPVDDDLLFYASEDIFPGAVIGHNYGEKFWFILEKSFSLFGKNTMQLLGLSTLAFNGAAYVIRDPDDGSCFESNKQPGETSDAYQLALLFIVECLLKANAVATNPTDYTSWTQWRLFANEMLKFYILVSLEKSVTDVDAIEVLVKIDRLEVEIALSLKDCMPMINRIKVVSASGLAAVSTSTVPLASAETLQEEALGKIIVNDGPKISTAKINLNSLYGFFRARQVGRYSQNVNIQDCEPPPGSQIYKGRTVVPNPLKSPAAARAGLLKFS
jgi:hypothetical protein